MYTVILSSLYIPIYYVYVAIKPKPDSTHYFQFASCPMVSFDVHDMPVQLPHPIQSEVSSWLVFFFFLKQVLIWVMREQGKQSISLEPGGQFELSGAPLETVHQTCAEVNSHLYQVSICYVVIHAKNSFFCCFLCVSDGSCAISCLIFCVNQDDDFACILPLKVSIICRR